MLSQHIVVLWNDINLDVLLCDISIHFLVVAADVAFKALENRRSGFIMISHFVYVAYSVSVCLCQLDACVWKFDKIVQVLFQGDPVFHFLIVLYGRNLHVDSFTLLSVRIRVWFTLTDKLLHCALFIDTFNFHGVLFAS